MGVFKILKKEGGVIYVSYHIAESEITIHAINLEENCLYMKINSESTSIKKWAQNLQQTPESYMSQLNLALKEQSENLNNGSTDAEEQKNSCRQNIFEFDGENNLIWKQFFHSKNIFGRKGKFLLEEKPRAEGLEMILNSIIIELNEKEIKVTDLEQENTRLIREKEELREIAEQSVDMKQNFETEIYGKFCALLNTKKRKNMELQSQLLKLNDRGVRESSPTAQSSSTTTGNGRDASDEEYKVDTDVDSPDDEVQIIEESVSNPLLKRRELSTRCDSQPKKSKSQNELENEQNSPDILNASLEADLKLSFTSQNLKKRH